ncbi:MAG: proline dehydrogenase family protein [Actinomycetota bacterium]
MHPLRDTILWASGNATLRRRLPRLWFVRKTVNKFMPGETADDAIAAAQRLGADGIPTTFTVLGENVTDLSQATAATGEYLRMLDRIAETGVDGEVSVKLTQLGFDLDPEHTAMQVTRLAERSKELGKTVWIDIESTGYVDGTLDLYEGLLKDGHDVGLCIQTYLKRTWDDLQRLLPHRPSIRLVKGAYKESAEHVFTGKRLIDEAYLRLATNLVNDPDGRVRRIVLGTHDVDLVARIERELGEGAKHRFELAMLYGIRTDAQVRYARDGYAIRTLISYGDYWYPWFMRRIAEKPVTNSLLALRNLV